MMKEKILEAYLRKIIEFCEAYDAFSIPAAMIAGGTEIKLQDIYTHLSCVKREQFERGPGPRAHLYDSNERLRNSDITSDSEEIEDILENLGDEIIEEIIRREKNGIQKDNKAEIPFVDEKISQSDDINHLLKKETNDEESTYGITDEEGDLKNEELNWTWFLSAPGGGKTTLLKMYSLAYAYKYYVKFFGRNAKLFEDDEVIENICSELKVDEGACPIFISVRELKEFRPSISNKTGFEELLRDVIKSFLDDENEEYDPKDLLDSEWKIIFIIDSVEEFASNNFRNAFLKGLDEYSCGRRCYLSSRYREYMENAQDTKMKRGGVTLYPKEEYVIDGLKNVVREYAERWYSALNKVNGGKELDVEKDFLEPLYKNANVSNIINNPLELTSLLMISSYDSCLPSDFVKIYGRSIELWLSWNNYARYNFDDVMRQLSQVAYQMAISENEKIVANPRSFRDYIKRARKDLKRYYHQEWPEDDDKIDEFIQFLCRSHLINRSTEGYDFIHRQYQAYLVAYCITTNNFSREKREKNRYNYIKKHLKEKDDFWNQIIIIIVMLDIDLRDDIINALFELSEIKDSASIKDANYYVSLLIQLANMTGVNFDYGEFDKLFGLIVQDERRWKLFDSKETELKNIFDVDDFNRNECFIKAVINRKRELSEQEQDTFRNKISYILFYCIWNYKANISLKEEALTQFFSDYISLGIVDMIAESTQFTSIQNEITDKLQSIVSKSLNDDGESMCIFLYSTIIGFTRDKDPLIIIEKYISEKTYVANAIAASVLTVLIWLIRCDYSNYPKEFESERILEYSDFIQSGIVDDKHSGLQRDYFSLFSEIFCLGKMSNNQNIWYKDDVFNYILRQALQDYEDGFGIYQGERNEFGNLFEHLSYYPCLFSETCKKTIREMGIDKCELLEKIQNIYLTTSNIVNKVKAAKLLFLISDYNYIERSEIIKEIEEQFKDFMEKNKAKRDLFVDEYYNIIEQLKKYIPEKDEILEDLNLSSFSISLSLEGGYEEKRNEILEFEQSTTIEEEYEEYVDYYDLGRYEEAKDSYLESFYLISSRNNLAYMLRRKEISSVEYKGKNYSVVDLLEEGVKTEDPYSLINYALYISKKESYWDYNTGLSFLIKHKESAHLLKAYDWWYQLRKNNEFEGYLVTMWLCDLGLGLFEDKEEIEKLVNEMNSGILKY